MEHFYFAGGVYATSVKELEPYLAAKTHPSAIHTDEDILRSASFAAVFEAFLKAMKENYLPVLKQSDPKFYRLRASYLRASYFWRHYPAHLHINIFPEYQHQGIGMRLMRNLLVKMRLNHIPSVALTVAKSHPGAIAFYKKNGFQVILRWFGALVLGRKL